MHRYRYIPLTLKTKILLVSLVLLSTAAYSQRWKSYRQEVGIHVGPSFLLGDVGGYQDAAKNNITDINFRTTRFSLGVSYNYFLKQNMSVIGQLSYLWLSARDNLAGNEARKYRNFDIRTHVVELSAQYRYYFIKDKFGHVFKLRGARSSFLSQISAYAGLGIAGLYFNPTGKFTDGKYYALQPLGTEGQGLPGAEKKYSRLTFAIPFSIGARYSIGKQISIGLEASLRKSFSDYIDDVSTVYYDKTLIEASYGEKAAYLSDPASGENPTWTGAGEKRGGEKMKDFYMSFMVSFNYKLLKGKAFRPRF